MGDWLAIGLPAALALLLLACLAVLLGVLAALLDRSGPIRLRQWAKAAPEPLRSTHGDAARFEVFRFLIAALAKATPLLVALLAVAALTAKGGSMGPRALSAVGLAVLGLLVAGETLNRRLVASSAEKMLRRLTPVYSFLHFTMSPLIAVGRSLVPPVGPEGALEEEDEASEEEIEAFLDVGAREGILEPGEGEMIQRVIDFGDAVVKSVMTPRIDMVCASVDSSLDELTRIFLEGGHSRVPLYRETVDDVVGILHLRDLLHGRLKEPESSPARRALPPHVVPETKRLNDLLEELQARRQQMAIVVDEFGGTAGLVTIEDLLEEIVGEIEDEHEAVHTQSEALPDGSWRVEGMAALDTVADLFDVDFEEEPYETIGGMIFGRLGDVPRPGSEVEAYGLHFIVERVEDRRIQTLRVRPGSAEAAGAE